MYKLNYTVKAMFPNNPAVDMPPVHVTDLAKDIPSWCVAKVSELMCLLGHAGESQKINIEWDATGVLILAYNIGTYAETRREYRVDSLVPVKDE